jgi:hypothetical protein
MPVSLIDDEDHARGARVEIAIRAAQSGDLATAAGILAGMSAEERAAITPLVTAAANHPPGDPGALSDLFGNTALSRIQEQPR